MTYLSAKRCWWLVVLAVVAWRGDLLGARLSNWLSAWRFGRKLGCETLIVWRNSDENRVYPYDLYTLFDRAGLDSVSSMRVELVEPPGDIMRYNWKAPLEWADAQWVDIDDVHLDDCISLPDNGLIDYYVTTTKLFPGEDVKAAQTELSNLFHALPLHSDILAALSDIHDLTAVPFAALHLRRGNLVDYLFKGVSAPKSQVIRHIRNFVPRYAHLNSYVRALGHHTAGDLPVIIFSDDLSLRAEAASTINRPVLDIHGILDGLGLSELQRAFVEFIVISRAKYVIGAKSQFSILPAKIGGAIYIDARKYAELPEIVDDLRPMILNAKDLNLDPRDLGLAIFKEFGAMYQRLNPDLSSAFSQLDQGWLQIP